MTDSKKQTNADTTDERPLVDDSASVIGALCEKLTDAQTRDLAVALAPYGVDLIAALAAQRDDRPRLTIVTKGAKAPAPPAFIDRFNVSSLFGWKPGETLDEAIARNKSEEG